MSKLAQDNLLAIAAKITAEYNVPVVKNIGLIALPAMSQEPFGGSGGGKAPAKIMPSKSVSDCGDLCSQLVRDGFASEVISQYDFQGNTTDNSFAALKEYRKFIGRKELQHYGRSNDHYFLDENRPYGDRSFFRSEYIQNLGYCWEGNIDEFTYYKACTLDKKFRYLSVFGHRSSAEPNEQEFGNSLVVKAYTFKGSVTWWQLDNFLENKNG